MPIASTPISTDSAATSLSIDGTKA
jgi:hypothetical protein